MARKTQHEMTTASKDTNGVASEEVDDNFPS